MSVAVPNSVDVDMFTDIKSNNEIQTTAKYTTPEEAFIAKHIHPPSAVPSYEGMPTNDARSQTTIQHVHMGVLSTSEVYPSFGIANNLITGFAFLINSGMRYPYYTYVKHSAEPAFGDRWEQDYGNTLAIKQYDVRRIIDDANKYRPTYRSMTTYLNATAFNNTGTVTSAQFNPPILASNSLTSLADTNPQRFRAFMDWVGRKGHVINIDDRSMQMLPLGARKEVEEAMKLTKTARKDFKESKRKDGKEAESDDEYIVVDGKKKPVRKPEPPLTIDFNAPVQFVDFGRCARNNSSPGYSGDYVPTNDELLNMSTRSYGGRAQEGTFSVQRLNTVTPKWLVPGNNLAGAGAFNSGLYICYAAFIDSNDIDQFYPLRSVDSNATEAFLLKDTLWSEDMTWTWVVYEGLTPNLLFATPPTQTIITKLYAGYEIQPAPMSPWAGSQRLGPKPSVDAMQALMLAYYDLKDCMPAKYNSAGLAALVRIGMQALGKHVLPAVATYLSGSSGKKKSTPARKKAITTTARARAPVIRQERRQRSRSRGRSASRSNNRSVDIERKVDNIERKFKSMVVNNSNQQSQRPRSRSKGRPFGPKPKYYV